MEDRLEAVKADHDVKLAAERSKHAAELAQAKATFEKTNATGLAPEVRAYVERRKADTMYPERRWTDDVAEAMPLVTGLIDHLTGRAGPAVSGAPQLPAAGGDDDVISTDGVPAPAVEDDDVIST